MVECHLTNMKPWVQSPVPPKKKEGRKEGQRFRIGRIFCHLFYLCDSLICVGDLLSCPFSEYHMRWNRNEAPSLIFSSTFSLSIRWAILICSLPLYFDWHVVALDLKAHNKYYKWTWDLLGYSHTVKIGFLRKIPKCRKNLNENKTWNQDILSLWGLIIYLAESVSSDTKWRSLTLGSFHSLKF
jgi:hypothetical protein